MTSQAKTPHRWPHRSACQASTGVCDTETIAVTNPFPPIAENDSVIRLATLAAHESLSVSRNLPRLTLAVQNFPDHLVIQNNSLYVTEPAQPQTIHAALSLRTLLRT
jgi:hypothetical protein